MVLRRGRSYGFICSECGEKQPEEEVPIRVVKIKRIITKITEEVIDKERFFDEKGHPASRELVLVSSKVEDISIEKVFLCPSCGKGRLGFEIEIIDQSQIPVLNGAET